jgi:hypothetical protein
MNPAVRKSTLILLGILFVEAIPFVILLYYSAPAGVRRLYAFDPSIWAAWLAAAFVMAGYVLYAIKAFPLIGRHFFDVHWLKLVAIPFAIVTGTMEEIWFRRLVMDGALHHGANSVVQVIASAFVFGLAHGIWGVFARQWRVAAGATIATGTLGTLLGIIYLLGGRQLSPCIWTHMLINLAIEPWLMVGAVSASALRAGPTAT